MRTTTHVVRGSKLSAILRRPDSRHSDEPTTRPGVPDPAVSRPERHSAAFESSSDCNDASDAAGSVTAAGQRDRPAFAPWHLRAAAFAIDVLAPVATISAALELWNVLSRPEWMLVLVIVSVSVLWTFILWNSVFGQGRTGTTVGKSLMRIRAVDALGQPLGWFHAFVRCVAYLLNTLPILLGWLWPLWSKRKQTFSDMLIKAVVLRDDVNHAESSRARTVRAAALAIAVITAIALVTLATTSYVTEYAHDKNSERTQHEIAQVAGDKAVAVLSYKPDTVEADIAAAKRHITGAFLEYYTKYADETVIPNSKREKIATSWELMGTAVTHSEPNSAEVLVYLDGVVTKAGADPQNLISSIRLLLTREDGSWFISGLDPL